MNVFDYQLDSLEMIFHERQIGAWCGVHALNNSLQHKAFDFRDAHKAAIKADSSLSEEIKAALSPHERQLMDANGNLDVTVIMEMLILRGYNPELVNSFTRLMRLIGSSTFNGSCLIVNSHSHYTAYRLQDGVWWMHDSMHSGPISVTQKQLLNFLLTLAKGKNYRLGRRIIYFYNPFFFN